MRQTTNLALRMIDTTTTPTNHRDVLDSLNAIYDAAWDMLEAFVVVAKGSGTVPTQFQNVRGELKDLLHRTHGWHENNLMAELTPRLGTEAATGYLTVLQAADKLEHKFLALDRAYAQHEPKMIDEAAGHCAQAVVELANAVGTLQKILG